MIRKKICLIGSFAVGKTSLVRRFVESLFDERYFTTVGVKVDKKLVELGDERVTLVIWDLHGDDEFQEVRTSYLRGMAGYLLVADGTRVGTVDAAVRLQRRAEEAAGAVPFLCLVNKGDLRAEWEVDDEHLRRLEEQGWCVRTTSAKTGEGVEEAFAELARRTVGHQET